METIGHMVNPIRIMSFNIHWEEGKPDHTWKERKERVASIIRRHHPDLIGLQEPFKEQLDDLLQILPEFNYYGIGLEDGHEAGPYDPIFFRSDRFIRLESKTIFLSPTPDSPSRGWGAKYPRGINWAQLKDARTGKIFFFFNTHFDYHSRLSRDQSALLLRKKICEIAGKSSFIVTGDFNLFPEMGGGETYQILTDVSNDSLGAFLVDAEKIATSALGPSGSWSGFKEAGQSGVKPDYIFVEENIRVYQHEILTDTFDGQFPSDHLPLIADIAIL